MNNAAPEQDDALDILRQMGQPESLRVVSVLLLSWFTVTVWCYYGSADFFRLHGAEWQFAGLTLEQRACGYEIVSAVLLLAVLPLTYMKCFWQQTFSGLGLGWGIPRRWTLATIALLPLFIFIAWLGSGSSELRAIYPRDRTAGDSLQAFAWYAMARFFFYLAWEIHFRGFLQMGLSRQIGVDRACVLQAVACSLAHLRGPWNETVGACIGGLWWGLHAFGSRSIWGTTLQHWFFGITVDAMICWRGLP